MTKSAPDPFDELYATPLADFIATRGRLAADLRKAGDKQGAADIKTAVKPSASAWAVNQAVRRAPEALGRLLEASDALREAQLKAGGGESRERYQEAVAEHRQAVDALAAEAEKALTEGGQKASSDLRERIAGNLRWAPQSADSRQLLEAGRLTKDVGPQDFGALLGGARAESAGGKVIPLHRPGATAPAKPNGGAAAAKDSGDSKAERAAEAERRREADRQRREQLAEARNELRTRRQEAERARKQQEKARADRESGEARVAELEEALAEAKKALAAAREDEKKGAVELHRAERNLQGADEAVGELEQE